MRVRCSPTRWHASGTRLQNEVNGHSSGHQARTHLDLVRERLMDRTSIGNSYQSRPLGSGHGARNRDVSGDLANIAVLGVAIRTILCVNLPVRQRMEKRSALIEN
jgi:hypothetical protein